MRVTLVCCRCLLHCDENENVLIKGEMDLRFPRRCDHSISFRMTSVGEFGEREKNSCRLSVSSIPCERKFHAVTVELRL